jgi:hypothetical protein
MKKNIFAFGMFSAGVLPLLLLFLFLATQGPCFVLIEHLDANPQSDPSPCAHAPSVLTCSHASPFGGREASLTCADTVGSSANLSGRVEETAMLGDPEIDEDPGNVALLQLWKSSRCHSVFASAQTSPLLRLFGQVRLTVSISAQTGWERLMKETSVTGDHAWTLLLYQPSGGISACLTVTVSSTRSYHTCINTSQAI